MRTRISIIHFVGALVTRGTRSLMAVFILAAALALGGCGPAMTRPQVSEQDLLKLRTKGDEQALAEGRRVLGRSLERAKAEYDRYTAGGRKEPPVIDILIISGGGDWGAFGAGFLKGWQKVPAQHPLAKPEFDAVTGVSTGTLIAPFAFLGDEQSIDEIVDLYRNPQRGLGEAARVSVFLAGQHFFRRGTWTGARDTQTHHDGSASPHREGGR